MADDGNRQLAISMGLNPEQFETLDVKLDRISDAINGLAKNISEPDKNLAAEVSLLRNELGMRLTLLNQSIVEASANVGKWLSAIAIATSTPEDNSEEVQKQIDEITSQLNISTAALMGEIDRQTKKET